MTYGSHDNDEKCKEAAIKFLREEYGYNLIPTDDEFNNLDGLIQYHGKNYGIEFKGVSVYRYNKYDDVMVEKLKYDYSIGEGKEASGLCHSYFITMTEFDDRWESYIVNFKQCEGREIRTIKVPESSSPEAKYIWKEFYSIPRKEAKHIIISKKNNRQ